MGVSSPAGSKPEAASLPIPGPPVLAPLWLAPSLPQKYLIREYRDGTKKKDYGGGKRGRGLAVRNCSGKEKRARYKR